MFLECFRRFECFWRGCIFERRMIFGGFGFDSVSILNLMEISRRLCGFHCGQYDFDLDLVGSIWFLFRSHGIHFGFYLFRIEFEIYFMWCCQDSIECLFGPCRFRFACYLDHIRPNSCSTCNL